MLLVIILCLIIILLTIVHKVAKKVVYEENFQIQTNTDTTPTTPLYTIIYTSVDYEREYYYIDIEYKINCDDDNNDNRNFNNGKYWNTSKYKFTIKYGYPYYNILGNAITKFHRLNDGHISHYDLAKHVKFLLINNKERIDYYSENANNFDTLSTYDIFTYENNTINYDDRIISRFIIKNQKYSYGTIYKITLGIVPYKEWDTYNATAEWYSKRFVFINQKFNDWKCPMTQTQTLTYVDDPRISAKTK